MSVITLLTDFGLRDGYAGIMKGVILSINPSAVIVDITHDIDPQDILEAAYRIQSAYRYFPPGTVHVVVVDPGVGSERSIIALKKGNHVFLFPDNGVLTLLVDEGEVDSVVRVDNPAYFLDSVSSTFHGRDIFAPVAAYLSKGVGIERIGTVMALDKLLRLRAVRPSVLPSGELAGRIVSIDRFGNLITNIDTVTLEKKYAIGTWADLQIMIDGAALQKIISGISRTYASVSTRQPLALIGSSGYLEIAVNCGSAADRFQAAKGDRIRLRHQRQAPKTAWG